MDCNQIDESMLDEVVMGRSRDAELIGHLGTCLPCSRRLVDHYAWVEELRWALQEPATDKRCRLPARSHLGTAMEARFTWVQHTRAEDHVARLQALAVRVRRIQQEIDALVAETKWADPSGVEMIQILRMRAALCDRRTRRATLLRATDHGRY